MSDTRLSPEKWIEAGFLALQIHGPQALAAEPLARQLGTTKGSFYWHFRDVPAYRAALLRNWHTQALSEVMAHLGDDGPADTRLRAFGRGLLIDPTEAALRVWSKNDPAVAASLAEVDTERLTYINHLLRRLGLRNPAFGQAMLAALVGLPQIRSDSDSLLAFDAMVDTVVALS